jgi:acyl dehydratase
MTVIPVEGTVLGEFESTLDRPRAWRVDWAVGLDQPEHLDPEVARSCGYPDIPLPVGALVFFSFLADDSWLDEAGIRFDRSLAVRRRLRYHQVVHVGDVVRGRTTIDEVQVRPARHAQVVTTTIATTYEVDGVLAVEEHVTYSTRHPEEGV